ncbi:BrnT family toxin, partial [Psychrobacter sp.]|uniref:BrnT family toxin n=1 Tax=Psychrobacter sp. TaxID=56811 RepID=UPI003F9E5CB3
RLSPFFYYSSILFDTPPNDEKQWQALGTVDGTAVLLVAHTQTEIDNGEVIRIISARRVKKIKGSQCEQS